MAQNISKSKYIKYYIFVLFLAVQMSKKNMSLWYEKYFEITIYKILHNRVTFKGSNAEKIYTVIVRNIFRNQNVKNISGSKILLEVYISLRFTTFHYTPLHNTTLHNTTTTTTQLHFTTLHYTTLHYTTTTTATTTTHLHTSTHIYTPLHSTKLHYTTLHYTTLHSTTLHYTTLHYTTLH